VKSGDARAHSAKAQPFLARRFLRAFLAGFAATAGAAFAAFFFERRFFAFLAGAAIGSAFFAAFFLRTAIDSVLCFLMALGMYAPFETISCKTITCAVKKLLRLDTRFDRRRVRERDGSDMPRVYSRATRAVVVASGI
jgi:hypothetical protein